MQRLSVGLLVLGVAATGTGVYLAVTSRGMDEFHRAADRARKLADEERAGKHVDTQAAFADATRDARWMVDSVCHKEGGWPPFGEKR